MKLYQLGNPVPVETFQPREIEELALFRSLVKPGALVFDIGAHIGDKAQQFLTCGARKVICVEPNPWLVAQMIQRFPYQRSVEIEPVGVGEKLSIQEFWLCTDAPTISTFSMTQVADSSFAKEGFQWDQKLGMCVTTLDRMIAKYGIPDFCKIDVEQYEREVLRGLNCSIPSLSFETSPDQWDLSQECIERLQALGMKKFNAAPGERGLFISPTWLEGRELMKRLRQEVDGGGDIYAQAN